VVVVFVSNEDRAKAVERFSDLGEPGLNLADAETVVDEDF
jgi:hypothetical protein